MRTKAKKKIVYRQKKVKLGKLKELQPNWEFAEAESVRHNRIVLQYKEKGFQNSFKDEIKEISLIEIASFGQIGFEHIPNSLIHGDNLAVLKYFVDKSEIAGKIKLIYIDPPYATKNSFKSGNGRTSTISPGEEDEIAYVDDLIGGDYLEFLRRRLVLLRELLSNDGSIYLHIDFKMGHYVKVLMDEVFGREHFINDIARIKCNPKNFSRKGYGNIKDMILFYSKTSDFVWNEPRIEMTDEEIKRLFPKIDKDGRRYTTNPLHAPGATKNGATGQKWKGLFPPDGRHWRVSPLVLSRLDKAGLIEWSNTGNPRKKIYADEIAVRGKRIQDVWEMKDPPYPGYPTEKNIDMLKRIISTSSNPGDLVLDCFAGSGTTLVAAEQLDRRWIGIDSSKVAINRALQRLKETPKVSLFALYETAEPKRKTK